MPATSTTNYIPNWVQQLYALPEYTPETHTGFDYIASPYTHVSPSVRMERYRLVRRYTAHALKMRVPVYSPIVHCHELSLIHSMPHDAAFWMWYNESMLARANALAVLQLPGWHESKGVALEVEFAAKIGLPIYYCEYTL